MVSSEKSHIAHKSRDYVAQSFGRSPAAKRIMLQLSDCLDVISRRILGNFTRQWSVHEIIP
jgi:hypothetical protein